MPVNRNALIRYKTLDKCLQNRYRKWTLEDLITACSDALYEYEGIDKGVSRRTVQGDIQMMRSDKLGYNAPIVVVDRKYYTYAEADYSITNIPLSEQDLGHLSEAVEFMKQFQGFSHFRELEGMVQKLEDHIYAQQTDRAAVIDFEKNELLTGLEYLDTLYKAIVNEYTLVLTYQSFKARSAQDFKFHPYLLKEYRNRWFVIGTVSKREGIVNLALDRIVAVKRGDFAFQKPVDFDASTYFSHVIGVTTGPNVPVEDIVLWVSRKHAPYVLSKPLHPSQELLKRDDYGVEISLKVQHNFELEKEILAFGEGMQVLQPRRLASIIRRRVEEALDVYDTNLVDRGIGGKLKQLAYRGVSTINRVFRKRALRKLNQYLRNKIDVKQSEVVFSDTQKEALLAILMNRNIWHIFDELVGESDGSPLEVRQIKYKRGGERAEELSWHQRNEDCWLIRIYLSEAESVPRVLDILPGSHKRLFTEAEIELITENTAFTSCNIEVGGIILLHPLLLRKEVRMKKVKHGRYLEVEVGKLF